MKFLKNEEEGGGGGGYDGGGERLWLYEGEMIFPSQLGKMRLFFDTKTCCFCSGLGYNRVVLFLPIPFQKWFVLT